MGTKLLVTGALLAGVAAAAADTITLFGQVYDVTRLDYSQEFTFPNPNPTFAEIFPVVAVLEVEGARYLGNDQIVLLSEKMSTLTYKSIAVVCDLEFDADGKVNGLAFNRILFWQDPPIPPAPGFDLSPSGLAVNTGPTGFAAGGNLLVTDTQNAIVHFYNILDPNPSADPDDPDDPNRFGFRIEVNPEFPSTDPEYGGLTIQPDADEPEDIVYVPERDEIYIIQEDETGSFGGFELVSFTPNVEFVSDVNIAGNSTGKPKGLAYLPDRCAYPPLLRGLGGSLMVSWDDDGPSLELFDLDGASTFFEPLDVPAAAAIDPGSQVLNVESVMSDPESGRLFLVQQGDLTQDNFLWVLEPRPQPDVNVDGFVNGQDFAELPPCHGGPDAVAEPECPPLAFTTFDVDCDGDVDLVDAAVFQQRVN
jgi:hypothetical protein